jgi:hypothetical protein
MIIMSLFERKIKGKNAVFIIKIKNPVPYPKQDIRVKKYGKPLCSIFSQYFKEIAVEYFKDEKNNIDQINVVCYKPNFTYKKSDENEFNAKLFRILSNSIKTFFTSIDIESEITDVKYPFQQSIVEYSAKSIMKGSFTPSEFKAAIITSPETKKEDLIAALNKKFNPSDMSKENMTISKTEDGRYFMGFISKKDGKRYYWEAPEKLVKKLKESNEI